MPDWPTLIELLRAQSVDVDPAAAPCAIRGGNIDAAWRLDATGGPIFLKTCVASDFERLSAEAAGLDELARAAAVRVPRVLACAASDSDAVLALEWLHHDRPDRHAQSLLGTKLAAMHRETRDLFGWHRDNNIGLTPQDNTPDENWPRFFRHRRLEYQLTLAKRSGYSGELQHAGAQLAERLDYFFDDYAPVPSLLHGDLWGGNWTSVAGEPFIFDPAVYFGDRETDLAMTRLFGGFGEAFYRSYEKAWPLSRGHRERELLYQLYHVLNHLNLFGGGYLSRALHIIRELNQRASSGA